jgi:hypothetical protein
MGIDKVAARIDDVLRSVASEVDAVAKTEPGAAPAPRHVIDATRLVLKEFEGFRPSIAATLAEFSTLFHELGTALMAEDGNLRGARTFGAKMATANRTSRRVVPAAALHSGQARRGCQKGLPADPGRATRRVRSAGERVPVEVTRGGEARHDVIAGG